jgi:hypothetical protein
MAYTIGIKQFIFFQFNHNNQAMLLIYLAFILMLAFLFYFLYCGDKKEIVIRDMPSQREKGPILSPQEAYVQSLLYN